MSKLFNFDYSYLSLPAAFYSLEMPSLTPSPEIYFLNESLCDSLNIDSKNLQQLVSEVIGDDSQNNTKSFAQAYAGHQFGHFNKLGDGRAIILGEHITKNNGRFDVQLKGSGRTLYSRNGDGKATLRAMLREYLISEAMHQLGIPTSRSLAVIKTGEPVYREKIHQGAALIRIMKSHLRVGTFQYARQFCSIDELEKFTNYTINRIYPEIQNSQNQVIELLKRVMNDQIDLVVNWMRVGFIHGVMNTDNSSISCETFDYGPCAFLNTYHPGTTFSSIDHQGRYSYGNQPNTIKWNLARFAEALLPIIDPDPESATNQAVEIISDFDRQWNERFYAMMLSKIGIKTLNASLHILVDELLDVMENNQLDYTNTFLSLNEDFDVLTKSILSIPEFGHWYNKWKITIANYGGMEQAKEVMRSNNPVVVPRNHLVELALDQAEAGNDDLFNKLLELVTDPYSYNKDVEEFMVPPNIGYDENYQTFCGT